MVWATSRLCRGIVKRPPPRFTTANLDFSLRTFGDDGETHNCGPQGRPKWEEAEAHQRTYADAGEGAQCEWAGAAKCPEISPSSRSWKTPGNRVWEEASLGHARGSWRAKRPQKRVWRDPRLCLCPTFALCWLTKTQETSSNIVNQIANVGAMKKQADVEQEWNIGSTPALQAILPCGGKDSSHAAADSSRSSFNSVISSAMIKRLHLTRSDQTREFHCEDSSAVECRVEECWVMCLFGEVNMAKVIHILRDQRLRRLGWPGDKSPLNTTCQC